MNIVSWKCGGSKQTTNRARIQFHFDGGSATGESTRYRRFQPMEIVLNANRSHFPRELHHCYLTSGVLFPFLSFFFFSSPIGIEPTRKKLLNIVNSSTGLSLAARHQPPRDLAKCTTKIIDHSLDALKSVNTRFSAPCFDPIFVGFCYIFVDIQTFEQEWNLFWEIFGMFLRSN